MTLQPPLVGAALAAFAYWLGGRGGAAGTRERAERRWRTLAFAAALASVVGVTIGPADHAADQLFWAHMVQHVVLVAVAPPLLVLSRPWNRMWRAFPLGPRRTVAAGIARRAWGMPLRALGRLLGRPVVAFVLMNGTLLLWHAPALYDAALASPAVHDLEHALFFSTALLLWLHLIPDGPVRTRLPAPQRAAYAIGSLVAGWGLAVVLADAPSAIFAHYDALAHRPGGISALTDQQLAAGVMWVPGSVPWVAAALASVYDWLRPERRRRRWSRRLAGQISTR